MDRGLPERLAQDMARMIKSKKEKNPLTGLSTIQGLLLPVEWDERGNVAAIAIYAFDEIEYLVEKDERGLSLLPLIKKRITAKGVIREEQGRFLIKIMDYETMS